MKRAGPLWAISQGLDLGHAEFGLFLVRTHRVSEDLPPGEIPPLPPKLVLPLEPHPQPADSLWKHSRE
jgi:hypothetical protein